MHDEKLIFSRRQYVQRVNHGTIDGQSAAAAAGDEDAERLAMLLALDGEKFLTHWNASRDRSFAKALGRFRKTAGHAVREIRQHAIGEARLNVRLKNHRRDAVQTC